MQISVIDEVIEEKETKVIKIVGVGIENVKWIIFVCKLTILFVFIKSFNQIEVIKILSSS